MTSANVTSTNHVIVIGMLDTFLVRERNAKRDNENGRPKLIEATRKEGRTRGLGGRWENMTLQVGGPYGGMFALPLELTPDVPGLELLDSAKVETLLAVEGRLQLKLSYDGRFASDRLDTRNHTDRGRPTRAMRLIVSRVREPNELECSANSAVWLEGVVAEPPQVARHPELPALQLGGTILNITFARPLGFPGVTATIDEIAEVNVAIPTNHRDAEKLFRPGNRVRAIGQLDCRMEFQGGESVRVKLAEIDSEWHTRKEELISKPGELRKAEEAWRRTRQKFEAAPRLYVLLGHAELLDGEPLVLAETYALRREFVREQRAQRASRRGRMDADRARRAAGSAAIVEIPVIAAGDDIELDPTVGIIKVGRPRKPARDNEAVAPVAVEGIEGVSTAEVTLASSDMLHH